MSLKLIEGWEDGFLAEQKYSTADGGTRTMITGRTGGTALQINNDYGGVYFPFSDQEFVIGFAMKARNYPWQNHDYGFFGAQYAVGGSHFTVRVDSGTNLLQLKRGRGNDGTLLATGTHPLPSTTTEWVYIEIAALVDDTVGYVTVHVNGQEDINFSGDTKNNANPLIQLRLGSLIAVDDIYICDVNGTVNNTFLGDVKVEGIRPNGNGNSSQGVGSDADSVDNYALVDDTTPDTADYVAFGAATDKDTYSYENLASSVGNVKGVSVISYLANDDAGAATARSVARLSGTESTGATHSATTSYIPHAHIYEEKPGTGAWTIADVNSAEFGIERVT